MAVEPPKWPDGDPGRVLLYINAGCSVDALFECFFGSFPSFQAKLHKERADTNMGESQWVGSRAELPQEQYAWLSVSPGAAAGTPAAGAFRKVRFDAPASLASKSFSTEEVQKIMQHVPGSHYVCETEVYTNAMYGDKFSIMSKYIFVAKGPSQATLHVSYVLLFNASFGRMMRPVVAKGVDGGIRGTFTVIRKLLASQWTVADIPDTRPPPLIPGIPAPPVPVPAAAAAPAAPIHVPVPPLIAVGGGGGISGAFGLADLLVYQELVAGISGLPDPALVAKALAVFAMLALLYGLVNLLGGVTAPLQGLCEAQGKGEGVLCWPAGLLVWLPDSLGEVLGSLVMVWLANRILLVGTGLLAEYLRHASAAQQQRLATAAAEAAAAAAAAVTVVASTGASAVEGPLQESSVAGRGAPAASAKPGLGLLPKSFTAPPRSRAAGGALEATSSQAHMNRAGTPSPTPAYSPISVAAAAAAAEPPAIAPPQAVTISRSPSPPPGAGSPVSESSQGLGGAATVMQSIGSAVNLWGRNLLGNDVVDTMSSTENLKNLFGGSGIWGATTRSLDDKSNGGVSVSSRQGTQGSEGGVPAAAAAADQSPSRHSHTPSFTTLIHDPSGFNLIEDYAQAAANSPALAEEVPEEQQQQQGLGRKGRGTSRTSSPIKPQRQSGPAGAAAGDGVSTAAVSRTSEKEAGARKAGAAGVNGVDGAMEPRVGAKRQQGSGSKSVGGWTPTPSTDNLSVLDSSLEEEPDEVDAEVYEHERVQPFRGWGHTWPGHFLPSDKVGHWGDRTGAPGGIASALFDRVAPRLPVGWAWSEPEWKVDLTGLDIDGVDLEGWSYGMDFTWLVWPPQPGMGKAGMKSFVRRRRWIRRRVRLASLEDGQPPLAGREGEQSLVSPSTGLALRRGGLTLGGAGLRRAAGVTDTAGERLQVSLSAKSAPDLSRPRYAESNDDETEEEEQAQQEVETVAKAEEGGVEEGQEGTGSPAAGHGQGHHHLRHSLTSPPLMTSSEEEKPAAASGEGAGGVSSAAAVEAAANKEEVVEKGVQVVSAAAAADGGGSPSAGSAPAEAAGGIAWTVSAAAAAGGKADARRAMEGGIVSAAEEAAAAADQRKGVTPAAPAAAAAAAEEAGPAPPLATGQVAEGHVCVADVEATTSSSTAPVEGKEETGAGTAEGVASGGRGSSKQGEAGSSEQQGAEGDGESGAAEEPAEQMVAGTDRRGNQESSSDARQTATGVATGDPVVVSIPPIAAAAAGEGEVPLQFGQVGGIQRDGSSIGLPSDALPTGTTHSSSAPVEVDHAGGERPAAAGGERSSSTSSPPWPPASGNSSSSGVAHARADVYSSGDWVWATARHNSSAGGAEGSQAGGGSMKPSGGDSRRGMHLGQANVPGAVASGLGIASTSAAAAAGTDTLHHTAAAPGGGGGGPGSSGDAGAPQGGASWTGVHPLADSPSSSRSMSTGGGTEPAAFGSVVALAPSRSASAPAAAPAPPPAPAPAAAGTSAPAPAPGDISPSSSVGSSSAAGASSSIGAAHRLRAIQTATRADSGSVSPNPSPLGPGLRDLRIDPNAQSSEDPGGQNTSGSLGVPGLSRSGAATGSPDAAHGISTAPVAAGGSPGEVVGGRSMGAQVRQSSLPRSSMNLGRRDSSAGGSSGAPSPMSISRQQPPQQHQQQSQLQPRGSLSGGGSSTSSKQHLEEWPDW